VGILNRISTIARANINALLDQAEDPAKMLDQLIRDMRDGIAEARTEVAKMIADEKELQANAERSQQLADEWQANTRPWRRRRPTCTSLRRSTKVPCAIERSCWHGIAAPRPSSRWQKYRLLCHLSIRPVS
jgi:hypothetical protein